MDTSISYSNPNFDEEKLTTIEQKFSKILSYLSSSKSSPNSLNLDKIEDKNYKISIDQEQNNIKLSFQIHGELNYLSKELGQGSYYKKDFLDHLTIDKVNVREERVALENYFDSKKPFYQLSFKIKFTAEYEKDKPLLDKIDSYLDQLMEKNRISPKPSPTSPEELRILPSQQASCSHS